jgi:hypothetical protein
MSIEGQTIFNIAVGAVNLLAGWMLKMFYDSIRDLRSAQVGLLADQRELERQISANYARRDDVKGMFDDLLAAIRRVEDKLDNKADK